MQLTLYRQGYLEARRLQTLLSLEEREPYRFVAARIIGKEQGALAKTLWIDKGEAHGLKPGMPVMALPGLIGRLTNVSRHSAKVQLLIDEGSNVDVLVERTRQQGMLRGAGSRGCVVRYISKIQDVREGDVILTSGLSNVFPKGLLVGKVVHTDRSDAGMFLNIRVSPFADFGGGEKDAVRGKEGRKMMYYVLLPFMAVVLVVLQSKLAEILFSGLLTLEMSLIVVIYAGFRLDLWKGAALSLVVGLAMDCLSGTVLGLFSLLYVCIFLFAWFVSSQIDSERLYLIAGFSLICAMVESLALVLIYQFVFEFDMVGKILPVLVPQTLLVSVLSVCFFYAMRRVERVLKYG